jgi:hypothetical protein
MAAAAEKSSIKGSNNHIKVCCRIRPVNGIDESELVQICSSGNVTLLVILHNATTDAMNL